MAVLNRFIYPVGHGGFAFEKIGGVSVVFDCGSDSEDRVKAYIDEISMQGLCVDYLFISHFDRDHVNCLEYFVTKLHPKKAVIPDIRNDMRIVYNEITDNAYEDILALSRRQVEFLEVANGQEICCVDKHEKWEWKVKNLMDDSDWEVFREELERRGIDLSRLGGSRLCSI